MSWKQHKNELIVLATFLLMLSTYFYKHNQISIQTEYTNNLKQSVNELKEVIALKKIWSNKEMTKKVLRLKEIIPSSKVRWKQSGNKVTVHYEKLTSKELNRLIIKVLNLPVIIQQLKIEKINLQYKVVVKCKW